MTRLDPGRDLTERLVTLPDGRRLRTVTGGQESGPLVVFEAGMSAPAAEWVHTQREIGARARTLSYDRAGYAGSDPDPQDRTLERLTDDLASLLDVLGETDPIVFVGHSWGGPILRLFAERHPERVAGLVFVDATLAECVPERLIRLQAFAFRVYSVLVRLGGKGLIKRAALPHGPAPEIDPADLEILWRDHLDAAAMRTARRECAQLGAAVPVMRRLQAAGTPDVPTICLQAGRIDRGHDELRPLFNRTAEDLMAAVPRGRVVVVQDAGHLIPQERPAAVHEAIVEVLDAAGRP